MENETIKLYENVTDEPILIRELSVDVPAHDRVSVKSAYPTPFNPVNYPGIVEVSGLSAEEHEAALQKERENYGTVAGKTVSQSAAPQPAPAPANGLQGELDTQKNPGGQPNA